MARNVNRRKMTADLLCKLACDSGVEIHYIDVLNMLGILTKDGFVYFEDVLGLADLMRPPMCFMICGECSICGHVTSEGDPRYCPNCGAKVIE